MCSQINKIDQLQEGDIIEFPMKVPDNRLFLPGVEFPFVLHYGIILIQDGQKKIGHNTFQNYPKIDDDIEKVLNGREIKRVIRTGIPSDKLIKNHNQVKDIKYNGLSFNCEDYVKKMTGVNVGLDQRIKFGIVIVLMIIIILLIIKKSVQ